MLVQVIGNAPSSQLIKPIREKKAAPVVRERVFGLPVDRGVLFTDDRNVYQPAIEKRQRQWIVKLAFLKSFLLPGERLLRMTSARSPVRWYAQWMTGGLFLGLDRAFLVFTSHRILHVPTDSAYRYRQSIAQIRYRDIRRIRLCRRTLIIDYKNDRTERFGGIALRERKKIRQLLSALPLVKEVRQPVGRRHLCPRCRTVLSERQMRCRRCALAFKTKTRAGLMALLFPGGGYFYARQFYPALLFLTFEAAVLAALAAILTGAVPPPPGRILCLAGLVLAWTALKTAAWLHGEHFLARYIPCRTKLGRWSSPAASPRT